MAFVQVERQGSPSIPFPARNLGGHSQTTQHSPVRSETHRQNPSYWIALRSRGLSPGCDTWGSIPIPVRKLGVRIP